MNFNRHINWNLMLLHCINNWKLGPKLIAC